ncbi:hypothetical protein [Sphingomonas albertensis]|uniref:hypothetical protein n=1 Tax=Sphingomonas albertensis TaxID=2762591 RepID=UPI0037DA4960
MVDSTYQVFVDLDATALEGGYVWVGPAYGNPEASPLPLFWDEALTIAAAQPLRTSGGYIVRDGTPANVYGAAPLYSVRVRNRDGRLVYYDASTGADVPASKRKFPIAAGADGPIGETGLSNNTRATLDELKAAAISDGTSLYDGSLWTWTAGDYTGQADDANIVKAGSTALTSGAWVRQASGSVAYAAPLKSYTVSLASFRIAADPVDNWSPTFQRAIDAVSAAGGGALLIPPGTYSLKVRVSTDSFGVVAFEMKTGVSLIGASKHATILKLAANQIGQGTYMRIISSLGIINNVGISNLTIDGNRDGQNIWKEQGNGGNIVLGTVRDCVIENIVSKNANGQCIQIASPLPNVSSDVTIRNNLCRNASGSTLNADGTIQSLYNGNGIGIQISLCSGMVVTGNIIRNCRDNAIDTYSDDGTVNPLGGGHQIIGNNISGCRVGVFPETASSVLVSLNTITDCVEGGIFANRINGAPQTVRITGNSVGNVPVGIRLTGDCLPANGAMIDNNNIYSITSTSGFGIQLGLPGANVSYVDVSDNIFGVNSNVVPLIAVIGNQAAYIRGTDNRYFGNPDPGYFLFKSIVTEVEVRIGGFIGVADGSVADLERRWARIGRLEATGPIGFFGAAPVTQQVLPAAATDLATTLALVNSLRTAFLNLGLGDEA